MLALISSSPFTLVIPEPGKVATNTLLYPTVYMLDGDEYKLYSTITSIELRELICFLM